MQIELFYSYFSFVIIRNPKILITTRLVTFFLRLQTCCEFILLFHFVFAHSPLFSAIDFFVMSSGLLIGGLTQLNIEVIKCWIICHFLKPKAPSHTHTFWFFTFHFTDWTSNLFLREWQHGAHELHRFLFFLSFTFAFMHFFLSIGSYLVPVQFFSVVQLKAIRHTVGLWLRMSNYAY